MRGQGVKMNVRRDSEGKVKDQVNLTRNVFHTQPHVSAPIGLGQQPMSFKVKSITKHQQ